MLTNCSALFSDLNSGILGMVLLNFAMDNFGQSKLFTALPRYRCKYRLKTVRDWLGISIYNVLAIFTSIDVLFLYALVCNIWIEAVV